MDKIRFWPKILKLCVTVMDKNWCIKIMTNKYLKNFKKEEERNGWSRLLLYIVGCWPFCTCKPDLQPLVHDRLQVTSVNTDRCKHTQEFATSSSAHDNNATAFFFLWSLSNFISLFTDRENYSTTPHHEHVSTDIVVLLLFYCWYMGGTGLSLHPET